jgi:hypothetical protein
MVSAVFAQDSGEQLCLRHYIKMREAALRYRNDAAALDARSITAAPGSRSMLEGAATTQRTGAQKVEDDAERLRTLCEAYLQDRAESRKE